MEADSFYVYGWQGESFRNILIRNLLEPIPEVYAQLVGEICLYPNYLSEQDDLIQLSLFVLIFKLR